MTALDRALGHARGEVGRYLVRARRERDMIGGLVRGARRMMARGNIAAAWELLLAAAVAILGLRGVVTLVRAWARRARGLHARLEASRIRVTALGSPADELPPTVRGGGRRLA